MTQIKLRRDTSSAFASSNPVLGNGEPAYETDTKKLKIGDGTTAYTQLEYFSAGGGSSTNITATLPLKIVDGVISLEVDGQTIQIVDGKLHANLDELSNTVNTLSDDVGTAFDLINIAQTDIQSNTENITNLQNALSDKRDKFETQVPLSISNNSITTSVDPSITETAESWTGGGLNKSVNVDVSALNIDANSNWKIHLSGYMGNYSDNYGDTQTLSISTENNSIFSVWYGSRHFRLGANTAIFNRIPEPSREFFYEIGYQKNGSNFIFNGTNLTVSDPLPISTVSSEIGQGTYTTLEGKGKLTQFSFVINSHQFRRIDKDISKSYFEADGIRYPITSVEGINTLKLDVGSGLSVVDGKLTATGGSSEPPVRYPVEVSDKSLMPSWYVVYNDGWIEQGGKVTATSNSVAVTLLKSFTNTNYLVIGSISGTVDTLNIPSANQTKFFDSFEFYLPKGGGYIYWKACGY